MVACVYLRNVVINVADHPERSAKPIFVSIYSFTIFSKEPYVILQKEYFFNFFKRGLRKVPLVFYNYRLTLTLTVHFTFVPSIFPLPLPLTMPTKIARLAELRAQLLVAVFVLMFSYFLIASEMLRHEVKLYILGAFIGNSFSFVLEVLLYLGKCLKKRMFPNVPGVSIQNAWKHPAKRFGMFRFNTRFCREERYEKCQRLCSFLWLFLLFIGMFRFNTGFCMGERCEKGRHLCSFFAYFGIWRCGCTTGNCGCEALLLP